jgi:hypothetical protein
MNRLNQTEPATFSILPRCAFFRDSVFIYFKIPALDIDCYLFFSLLVYALVLKCFAENIICLPTTPRSLANNFPSRPVQGQTVVSQFLLQAARFDG